MDVVQIECGNCGKVMAVRMAHLGAQVHCPHCRAIVEAPPHPNAAPEIQGPKIDVAATESIFAEPEDHDALFDDGQTRPLVEMPAGSGESEGSDSTMAYNPADKKAPNLSLDRTIQEDEPAAPKPASWLTAPLEPPKVPQPQPPKPPSFSSPAGSSWEEKKASSESAAREESPSSMNVAVGPSAARLPKPSNLPIILLIFLVPYAVIATVVILFLLNNQRSQFDPMERLPDPKPKDGGARVQQVAHDTPLPAKLKTVLAKPLRIGDLEVTPLKVRATIDNDLALDLKMRNLSQNLVFNPVSDAFLRYVSTSMHGGKPYTYLDTPNKKFFGGFADWLAGPPGQEEAVGGDIGPGQEELIRITTDPKYREDIRGLRNSKSDLTWRVQVRRGFVQVRGKDLSATAVVGVQFNAAEIN